MVCYREWIVINEYLVYESTLIRVVMILWPQPILQWSGILLTTHFVRWTPSEVFKGYIYFMRSLKWNNYRNVIEFTLQVWVWYIFKRIHTSFWLSRKLSINLEITISCFLILVSIILALCAWASASLIRVLGSVV